MGFSYLVLVGGVKLIPRLRVTGLVPAERKNKTDLEYVQAQFFPGI